MKIKVVSGIMLTLLFIGMSTLTFDIQPVKASGTIVIRADGSVDPPTANITSTDNITYTFTNNISDEIFVERSNIVVDGNGSTLQGTGSGMGIVIISAVSNVTIKNMEINGFEYGIWINASSNYNSVSGNRVKNNTYGIWLDFSLNNTVSGNTITNSDYGVYLDQSSNNTFYHNNFINNTYYAYSPSHTTNTWDDGYPSGGNYWSWDAPAQTDLYGGPYQNENGSDGIGDTAHNVTYDRDNYPLMNPWTPTETSIEVLGVSHPVTIESNTTITQIATTNNTLSFTSSGPTGEKGYILLIFPMVNTTEIEVYIDGEKITPLISTNGTHYFIYFEFTLSTHEITIQYAIHDIAVINVTASPILAYSLLQIIDGFQWVIPTEAYPTWVIPLNITATVLNNGTEPANFTVTTYYNDTLIETLPVTNLAASAEMNLTFSWNLTEVNLGLYTIKANATLDGDTNPDNNEFVDDTVKVKMPGDIDGDADVDGVDYFLFVGSHGASKFEIGYRLDADLNADGTVDGEDYWRFFGNYGLSTTAY